MNIVVFDTETTSLTKPFCYNVGYIICDEKENTLIEKEFIIEQIWHNLPLFSTAYYADKRPFYIKEMRKRNILMDKFGYICQEMKRDFKKYDVKFAYAYNSSFDEKVFTFNCDWFKCMNPFDTIPIFDIRGNAHNFLVDEKYKQFCIDHDYFTETGCYSSTAETVYRYLTNNTEWSENHTALDDSRIEKSILFSTIALGAKLGEDYKAKTSLGYPNEEKTLHIKTVDLKDYYFNYKRIRINKPKTEIALK